MSWQINDRTLPVYLLYDEEVFDAFMKSVEFYELLLSHRIVFFRGEESVQEFFTRDMVRFPDIIYAKTDILQKKHIQMFESIIRMFNEQSDKHERQILEYYKEHDEEILKRIKNGCPRILVWTSRFTTALKYHALNLVRGAKTEGMQAESFLEKNAISQISKKDILKKLYDYKPDILILLDHFRFEDRFEYPSQLVVVTWIQDPLPNIMNPEAYVRLTERDVIMNHIISYSDLLKLYPGKRMIKAPIPANEEIYKMYCITDSEREKYSADICMVCHGADVEGSLNEWIEVFDESMRSIIKDIFFEYIKCAVEGRFCYSKKEFIAFFAERFKKYQLNEQKIIDYIAENMYLYSNQCVFRQVIADWLIEEGYENIKLWGNGWLKSPKYSKYAMGVANNGEELSKICQSSKIVLGNNIMTTAAARVWETMLSGGFYMSNYIPPENDICDIRDILTTDEFVMFYDKKDLISKVNFYLEHEEERQIMINRGREAALKKMTFCRLMDRVIKETSEILDEQIVV